LIDAGTFRREVQASLQRVNAAWNAYLQTYMAGEEARLLGVAKQAQSPVRRLIDARLQLVDNGSLKAQDGTSLNQQTYEAYYPMLDGLHAYQVKFAGEFNRQTGESYEGLAKSYVIGCVSDCAVGAGCLALHHTPSWHMHEVISHISEHAELTRRLQIEGTDELAQTGLAFNSMMDRFQVLVGELGRAVEQLTHPPRK
jgi:methyl-accepting chemotaxis protein